MYSGNKTLHLYNLRDSGQIMFILRSAINDLCDRKTVHKKDALLCQAKQQQYQTISIGSMVSFLVTI